MYTLVQTSYRYRESESCFGKSTVSCCSFNIKMQKFESLFGTTKARVIGMIHANALPGTALFKLANHQLY